MNDREQDHRELTTDEARALAVLKHAEMAPVPGEVRERIRRAFLTGETSGNPLGVPIAATFPRAQRIRRWRRAATTAAGLAAAATTVLVVWAGFRPVGSWRVLEAIVPEGIQVPRDARKPAETLAPGSRVGPGEIRVGGLSELELDLDSKLRLRMLSGTQTMVPAAPGRWFGRDRTLEVRAGEVFGTAFEPLGFRFRLWTPEAEAVLSGTSFAVIRNEEATCFCLYRGRLDITESKSRERIDLPIEHRVVIYRDGRKPLVEPITDRERMKLSMMDAARPGAPPR